MAFMDSSGYFNLHISLCHFLCELFYWQSSVISFMETPMFWIWSLHPVEKTSNEQVDFKAWSDSCFLPGKSMLTVASFTVAKNWRQPCCPSTDKWIVKICILYVYYIYIPYTHTIYTSYIFIYTIYATYMHTYLILFSPNENEMMVLECILLSEIIAVLDRRKPHVVPYM